MKYDRKLSDKRPAPESIEEQLAAATSPAEVNQILDDWYGDLVANEAASPAPAAAPYNPPKPAFVVPQASPEPEPAPVVRAEAPLYPSVAQPQGGPYWGPKVEWDKARAGAGGARTDEALAPRQANEPFQGPSSGTPLEQALAAARTPAEVLQIMRQAEGQTGIGVVDQSKTAT